MNSLSTFKKIKLSFNSQLNGRTFKTYTKLFNCRMSQINNSKARNNLPMETKVGNTCVAFSTDAVLGYPVRTISAIAGDLPAMLAEIFANLDVG
jgi:hypothetical protein